MSTNKSYAIYINGHETDIDGRLTDKNGRLTDMNGLENSYPLDNHSSYPFRCDRSLRFEISTMKKKFNAYYFFFQHH